VGGARSERTIQYRLAARAPLTSQDRKLYAVQSNHVFLTQLCRETGQRHFVARSGPSWLLPNAPISLNLCCLLHEHATFFLDRGYINKTPSQNLCEALFVSVAVSHPADASSAAGGSSCLPTRKSGSRQALPPLPRAGSEAAAHTGLCCVVLARLAGDTSGVAVRESRAGHTQLRGVRSGLDCRRLSDVA